MWLMASLACFTSPGYQLIYTLTRTITYLYVDVNQVAKVFFRPVPRRQGCGSFTVKAAVENIRITRGGYGKAGIVHSGSGRRGDRRRLQTGKAVAGGEARRLSARRSGRDPPRHLRHPAHPGEDRRGGGLRLRLRAGRRPLRRDCASLRRRTRRGRKVFRAGGGE